MKKIIEIDTDLVKVVPLEVSSEISSAGHQHYQRSMEDHGDFTPTGMFKAMVSVVPGVLPGVVDHSGEPVAATPIGWDYFDNGQLVATYAVPVLGKVHPKLFTHPPVQPDTKALQARIAELEGGLCVAEKQLGDEIRHLRAQLAAQAVQSIFPERDLSKPAEQQGIFHKFDVRRTDGSSELGGKHHGCRYFVLDMEHDPHAKAALQSYATSCANTHPHLSADLIAEFGAEPVGQEPVLKKCPDAWLTPHLISFDGVKITSCPVHSRDKFEGVVAWGADIFCDSDPVKDRDGVEHSPKPLYIEQPAPANSIAIVQATLDAAAEIVDTVAQSEDPLSPEQCAKAIRELDKQTIIDAAMKEQA